MAAQAPYPVRLEGELAPQLSRWLWLVKWLLLIPHYVVLAFLWIASAVVTVIAFFAILFTARYPRTLFDFNVGVLRWTWRVAFYSYGANGTDRYPPFTLADADYPARFDVAYPERLSRGLIFVKWLLAIPHLLIVAVFSGGGWAVWANTHLSGIGGLVTLIVLIACIALLFTGEYPRSLFDFAMGLNRWTYRVLPYVGLMRDEYPPFRLDQGPTEPGGPALAGAPSPAAPGTPPPLRMTAGRVILVVIASIAGLVALACLVGGMAAVVVDQTQRDKAGYISTSPHRFATDTYALVSESYDIGKFGADFPAARDVLGKVRITSESAKPVFVGIARKHDVDVYLGSVLHAEVTNLGEGEHDTTVKGSSAPPGPPAARQIWVASAQGAGPQALAWNVQSGNWRVVVMNADATRGVDATLSIGAELPDLLWIGVGLLGGGAVFLALSAGLLFLGLRRRA